jgi:hypothetical protein
MEKKCERCRKSADGFDLLDYCAKCSKDLCEACMKAGCCGSVPAESGTDSDYTEYET